MSALIYRDAFNRFDQATEDDNLIQTYVPVRVVPTDPILGVMEIYTDGNAVVARNERAELYILAGLAAILGILYVYLLFVVRRAAGVIERQQQTIRERTATLELLSAHMLSAEEEDKKSIAFELHEGVAQTLCSIKIRLEHQLSHVAREGGQGDAVAPIIPVLQNAIEDVRELARGLRPPSLDELGLLPTIEWFCGSFERLHQDISIESSIALREEDMPLPLKIVLYRIIESTFWVIARLGGRNRVRLALNCAADAIELEIEDTPRDSRYLSPALSHNADQRLRFSKVKERIAFSGGSFHIRDNAAGGMVLRASWLRVSLEDLPAAMSARVVT
jgi:signal transduction histidine kinase